MPIDLSASGRDFYRSTPPVFASATTCGQGIQDEQENRPTRLAGPRLVPGDKRVACASADPDPHADPDVDAHTDPHADADTDPHADADTDPLANADTDGDSDANADTDDYADRNDHPDRDVDTHADADDYAVRDADAGERSDGYIGQSPRTGAAGGRRGLAGATSDAPRLIGHGVAVRAVRAATPLMQYRQAPMRSA
jgi:hypothetical protein